MQKHKVQSLVNEAGTIETTTDYGTINVQIQKSTHDKNKLHSH